MMRHALLSRAAFVAAIAFAGIASTGCAHRKPVAMNHVSGTAICPPGQELDAGSVAYVRLADVTHDRVQGQTIKQAEIKPDGRTISFDLPYREKDIKAKRDYAVDVRVVDRNGLVYITRGGTAAITKGNPGELDLTLERAADH